MPVVHMILHERTETVDGPGEFRLGRAARLELFPEGDEFIPLVAGEKAENALRGRRFGPVFMRLIRCIQIGIARVDLHDVVDKGNFHYPAKVDFPVVGVFRHYKRHHCHVPRMLGIVFIP